MSHRKSFLITYDIADSKRLRRVFRIVSDYATPVQLSVFEASLTEAELTALTQALIAEMDEQVDNILCYRLSPDALCVELGRTRNNNAILV